MSIRPKTKRRLFILGLAAFLVVGAGAALYLRYVQKRNAELAEWRRAAFVAYEAGDYPVALEHFSKYLAESKTADRPRGKADTQALFAYGKSRAAVERSDNRHLVEAKGIIERYLMLSPGDAEAERMLLELYPKLDLNAEAVMKADEVLARDPADVHALKAKTKALIQSGLQQDAKRFPEAVEAGEKLNAAAPLDLEGHLLTQYALVAMKRPADELIGRAEKQLQTRPEDPRFELLLASAHLYANRLDEARKWLTAAAARQAPDVPFVTELVTRLDALAMFRQSQDVLDRAAAQFNGDLSLTRLAVQRQWQSGRHEAVADRLASLDPAARKSDATLLGLRALSLQALGRKGEAKAVADALAGRGTSDSAAFAWSTALRARFAEPPVPPKDQVEKYRAALEKDPGNAIVHHMRGEAYARLGESTLAMDAWTDAARRAPSWAARARIAAALAAEGRFGDGVRVAEDAYRRARDDLSIVIVWAQAAYGLLETMPDQRELDRLLRAVEEIQQAVPGEPNTLPIHAAVLARSGRKEDAAKVIQSALKAEPAPSAQVVARLAAVSRDNGLGLDEALAERLRGRASEGGPAAAYAAAIERYDAGKAPEGLKLLTDARDKAKSSAGAADSSAAGDLQWRLALAQYLDLINDPSALKEWTDLAKSNPNDLRVQSAALRARCRSQDRAFWKATIDRVKQLTVENSQLWRLEEAKWLLTGHLGEKEHASVLTTLTELSRNAPHSAEPHRLLAIAYERSAAAGTASQSDIRKAAEEIIKASDLRPADVGIVSELARLVRTAGRGDEVGRYLDRAAASPALDRADRLRLAELYAQHDQTRKAIELASPLGAEAAPRLARWHRALGQPQQAVELYNRLLAEPDIDAQTVLDAAGFFAEQGDADQADKFLARLDAVKGLQPGARELVRAKFSERHRPPEATKWYAAAAATPGASAGVWRELAGHHLRHRRFEDAAAAAEQGLKAYASDADLVAMRARARELAPLAQDRAVTPLLGFLSFDPRNVPANEMLTILRDAAGKGGGAAAAAETVARLRDAADRHPNFLPLQAAAVRGLLRTGDFQRAEAVARRAVASFPDDVEAVRLLAAVYSAANKWAELRDAATTWRNLTPQDALEPDVLIARALLNSNEPTAAADRLAPYAKAEAAKAQAPATQTAGGNTPAANAEVLELYARALIAQGKSEDAAALLEPLARQSPAWRRLWLDLAGAFRSLDLERAAKWVTRIETSVAKDVPAERRDLAAAWYVVGREFNDRESLANAKNIAKELTSPAANGANGAADVAADAWMIMASCDEAAGNLADAEREYRQALALRPGQPAAQNNLAYVLLLGGDAGRLEEAHSLAAAATSAAPSFASFHDTLARVEAKRGHFDAAITSFRKALSLDPSSLEAMIGLAEVLSKTDRRDEAKAQLAHIDSAMATSPRLPANLKTQLDAVRSSLNRQTESGRVE